MLNSGVYGIFSKIDDRVYIGSATNFDLRKKTHFDKLKSNVHVNKPLQNFVNKYGIEQVEFKILAKCPSEYCIKLEQFFLDNYQDKFNIRIIAESNFGLKASEETKQKMSDVKRGKKPWNAGVSGYSRQPQSEETKQKIRESRLRTERLKRERLLDDVDVASDVTHE